MSTAPLDAYRAARRSVPMSAAASVKVMQAPPACIVTVPGSERTMRGISSQTCDSSPSGPSTKTDTLNCSDKMRSSVRRFWAEPLGRRSGERLSPFYPHSGPMSRQILWLYASRENRAQIGPDRAPARALVERACGAQRVRILTLATNAHETHTGERETHTWWRETPPNRAFRLLAPPILLKKSVVSIECDRLAIQRYVGPTPRRLRGGSSGPGALGACQSPPQTPEARAGGHR